MIMAPVKKRERSTYPPTSKAAFHSIGHRERSVDRSLWAVKKKANGAMYWAEVDEEMERQRREFFSGLPFKIQ